MEPMTKAQKVANILTKLGLEPSILEDTFITFRFEMKYVYAVVEEKEEDNYTQVRFPNFYPVEQDEVVDCLLACNKCNRDLRQIKVFMNKEMTDIDASFEFSYTSDEELKEQLNHALFMIGYVRRGFMDALEELHEGGSDDDSSEIEEIQEDDND